MDEPNALNWDNVRNVVEEWFLKLQYERKCNSTNTVSKIVHHSTEEIQENIRKLISNKINIEIERCLKSKDIEDMQKTCNVINGCFDNFVHAVDGVRNSFEKVISFVDFGIDECQLKFLECGKTLVVVLELLHCLSRILILVLKFRRTQCIETEKDISQKKCTLASRDLDEKIKKLLQAMTQKLGFILTKDEVLIDTKNNFAIAGLLIREILTPDEKQLKQYQKQLLATIPCSLTNQNKKLDLLKFLLCGAIINTWSTNIIDEESTHVYLKFFVSLCENYSSETPVILNTSRTLLLLIKHKCFKEFVMKSDHEKLKKTMESLLACVFMLLEHPVACVRHSAKDFLLLLSSYSSFQPLIIDSVFKLPKDKRSYFIGVGAVASELGSRSLIEKNHNLPRQLIDSLNDPTIVSHVSFAVENMILKDSLAETNFSKWSEVWIIPLLVSLVNVLPINAAEIDKLLEKAFKKYPNLVLYVIEKWKEPKSGEELRCIITALKISHKQGFKFKANSNTSTSKKNGLDENKIPDLKNNPEKKWKKLISQKLLEHCLHHGEDEIRISAFSLLVETRRTAEPYSEVDFQLIRYFLKYNLNNQQPATRQKILGLIRKMLVRFSESRAALQKGTKNNANEFYKSETCLMYEDFLNSLIEFCFSNIFVGCNFNRLNTVLNILFLCFENIRDLSFNTEKTNYYWNKFLIALDSSYEENKELAILLSGKLNFSFLDAAKPENARLLFDKSFSLISHMEPPDVLTGSYLLQILINLPSAKQVLLKYFLAEDIEDEIDIRYYCIRFLTKNLMEQVLVAKLDLMIAATCGPMYGTLFAIRLLFKDVNFHCFNLNGILSDKQESSLTKWRELLNKIAEVCFDLIPTVSSVVNSSSPEGHLPMDFQTDFQNLIISDCKEDCYAVETEKDKIKNTAFANFINKYKKIECAAQSSLCDVYEILRSLKCLLKENKLLLLKMDTLKEANYVSQLNQIKDKIENLIHKLDKNKTAVDWPATAQVLLLCAWRSIKEASLYLGDFISKLPVEVGIDLKFLSITTITRIGEELKTLLCEIKHRGSFEHVYVGFTQFVNSLWKCANLSLSNLPRQWLEEIVNHLELPAEGQKLKLCSTRRSAGLPFLVQAIICSEIISVKSSTPSTLHDIMRPLLKITEMGVSGNPDSKIHALNIMRALFKHAQLGEHVSSYISKAIIAAIRGSRGPTWPERNSSNLLFSSLMIRIFGVSRSRDEISRKNRMTSRTFFQRYSELYKFLLSEMKLVYSPENCSSLSPKPSLYLVLLILGRLYPTPREDPETLDLSEFLPFINISRRHPTMKIRELAARALVPLIPPDKLLGELESRFSMLHLNNILSQNERHGILLQMKALLKESTEVLENLSTECIRSKETPWIENTKWMLQSDFLFNQKISLVVVSTYLEVLHILFKNFTPLRAKIAEVILNSSAVENLNLLKESKQKTSLGIYLCLESFYYLKEDIVAHFCLNDGKLKSDEMFFNLFYAMLECRISEVQSIPLRIICSILKSEIELKTEDDDFVVVGAPVNGLLIFQKGENIEHLRNKIFGSWEIAKRLMKPLNNSNSNYFKSKVIHRLWLKALGSLIIEGVISVAADENSYSSFKQTMGCLTGLLKSNDKEISSNALIIYSAYLFQEILRNERKQMTDEELSTLSSVLKMRSSPDSDIQEKLAIAKIMNYCFEGLIRKNIINAMNLWMVPVKLLLDEDSTVRSAASKFVNKMQVYLSENFEANDLLIRMEILNWPICSLVPLKAQECLLDSYINLSQKENCLDIVVNMLPAALSSFSDVANSDSYAGDEFGVFEKGNPNPYCEELAFSNTICAKLSELRRIIDFPNLMKTALNEPLCKFLSDNFHMWDFPPVNLLEAIKRIAKTIKEDKKKNKEFSVLLMQKKNLINALGFSDEFF